MEKSGGESRKLIFETELGDLKRLQQCLAANPERLQQGFAAIPALERLRQYFAANPERLQQGFAAIPERLRQGFAANPERLQQGFAAIPALERLRQYFAANPERLQQGFAAIPERLQQGFAAIPALESLRLNFAEQESLRNSLAQENLRESIAALYATLPAYHERITPNRQPGPREPFSPKAATPPPSPLDATLQAMSLPVRSCQHCKRKLYTLLPNDVLEPYTRGKRKNCGYDAQGRLVGYLECIQRRDTIKQNRAYTARKAKKPAKNTIPPST